MNDITQPRQFTCKTCGGHELIVTHIWNILAGNNSERWQEWGPLKGNHHWHYEFEEKIEKNADDEVQRGDFGEFQEDNWKLNRRNMKHTNQRPAGRAMSSL